ncbi:MAG: response regulator transcription factor [Crocinitomicaceae bacterium]|nr:response regulator transcription factor [Crocinitomicaceae bacterium]
MKILFVEDDRELLKSMMFYFSEQGFNCEKARTVEEGVSKLHSYDYDCAVLDLGLPDGSGMDILKEIRSSRIEVGVIILSANSNLDNKIDALDFGADDYLTKPFHLSELNSRIKSIIRRKKQSGSSTIQLNEMEINTDAKEVKVNNELLHLTKKEYDMLLYFYYNRNKVVTKSSIAEHLWGDFMDQTDSFDSVYSHLKNLKKKIKDCGGEDYIKSMYGVGYIFKV